MSNCTKNEVRRPQKNLYNEQETTQQHSPRDNSSYQKSQTGKDKCQENTEDTSSPLPPVITDKDKNKKDEITYDSIINKIILSPSKERINKLNNITPNSLSAWYKSYFDLDTESNSKNTTIDMYKQFDGIKTNNSNHKNENIISTDKDKKEKKTQKKKLFEESTDILHEYFKNEDDSPNRDTNKESLQKNDKNKQKSMPTLEPKENITQRSSSDSSDIKRNKLKKNEDEEDIEKSEKNEDEEDIEKSDEISKDYDKTDNDFSSIEEVTMDTLLYPGQKTLFMKSSSKPTKKDVGRKLKYKAKNCLKFRDIVYNLCAYYFAKLGDKFDEYGKIWEQDKQNFVDLLTLYNDNPKDTLEKLSDLKNQSVVMNDYFMLIIYCYLEKYIDKKCDRTLYITKHEIFKLIIEHKKIGDIYKLCVYKNEPYSMKVAVLEDLYGTVDNIFIKFANYFCKSTEDIKNLLRVPKFDIRDYDD